METLELALRPDATRPVGLSRHPAALEDQRFLWGGLEALRAAIDAQAPLSLPRAVAQYVEGISGQHGYRLEALLARTGLGGQDPITNREMARRLGVSDQRASQIVQRLWYHRDRFRPLPVLGLLSAESGTRDASAGLEIVPAVSLMAGSQWGRGSSVMLPLPSEAVWHGDIAVI